MNHTCTESKCNGEPCCLYKTTGIKVRRFIYNVNNMPLQRSKAKKVKSDTLHIQIPSHLKTIIFLRDTEFTKLVFNFIGSRKVFEVMEDYLMTCKWGYQALDQEKHMKDMQNHWKKLKEFITKEKEISYKEGYEEGLKDSGVTD